ncbi:unnamed protein product, partial [Brenthis ino]
MDLEARERRSCRIQYQRERGPKGKIDVEGDNRPSDDKFDNASHRKKPPKKAPRVTLVEKILSSTRTICSVRKEKESLDLCPSCMWGPKVGYDDVVWHKLGNCPWWPARVLTPGTVPSCLLSRSHSPHQWPLKYYGTLNHSWGDSNRMCLFLPKHTRALEAKDDTLRQAVLDASDDYIAVYLT